MPSDGSWHVCNYSANRTELAPRVPGASPDWGSPKRIVGRRRRPENFTTTTRFGELPAALRAQCAGELVQNWPQREMAAEEINLGKRTSNLEILGQHGEFAVEELHQAVCSKCEVLGKTKLEGKEGGLHIITRITTSAMEASTGILNIDDLGGQNIVNSKECLATQQELTPEGQELADTVKEGTVEGTGVEAEASYMWDDVEF
ncbi:hypothetical protein K438DRAFT_1768288 [Mycena galopus ATCC 62051]|nr:hypothetical protein K438DRAFT_1768288 [Mycena galopus ATCC 62051]